MYVVVSRQDDSMFGPFDSEDAAITWAKGRIWKKGCFINIVSKPH